VGNLGPAAVPSESIDRTRRGCIDHRCCFIVRFQMYQGILRIRRQLAQDSAVALGQIERNITESGNWSRPKNRILWGTPSSDRSKSLACRSKKAVYAVDHLHVEQHQFRGCAEYRATILPVSCRGKKSEMAADHAFIAFDL
jgi:hypothetical protein